MPIAPGYSKKVECGSLALRPFDAFFLGWNFAQTRRVTNGMKSGSPQGLASQRPQAVRPSRLPSIAVTRATTFKVSGGPG